MLCFAAICPHPPIIVPGIGDTKSLNKVKKTISAMEKLALDLEEADPDIIIIISPHGLLFPDQMNILYYPKLRGDFTQFGAPQISFEFESDPYLAQRIHSQTKDNNIATILFNNKENVGELDHGCLVPLYYLMQNLSNKVKILPIYYSYQGAQEHFSFGEVLADVINSNEFKDIRIAVVASGDLSHRLLHGAPAGYSEIGKEFDKKFVSDIKNKKSSEILSYDSNWLESAGECGYRSIATLLGIVNKTDYKPEILSYEGPFGVGYLVANLKLQIM